MARKNIDILVHNISKVSYDNIKTLSENLGLLGKSVDKQAKLIIKQKTIQLHEPKTSLYYMSFYNIVKSTNYIHQP